MKNFLLCIIALLAFGARAQNIFNDDFSSYTSGAQLSGQGSWSNNSSNPGGTGAAGGALPDNAKIIDSPIAYLNYGSSTKSLQVKASDGCGRGFAAVTSGNVYVAFVLNLSSVVSGSNADFIRVMSGNNFNSALRITATPSAGAFFLNTSKNTGANVATSLSYSYNQDHLVVIKYTLGAGSNDDVVTLFVDPIFASGEPATNSSINNSGNDFSGTVGLDRFCFRQNGSTIPVGKVGLVSVSTTWAGLSSMLDNQKFNQSTFDINANQAYSGLLTIKSALNLPQTVVNIYDIKGSLVDSKTIDLFKNDNLIAINPLSTAGVYLVEIIAGDFKVTNKIVVQ